MGDNRISHTNGIVGRTNQLFDVGSPTTGNRNDLFLRSESPRVQQILLHQRLREEIEKNPNGKVRYIDSELYIRNQELRRSPAFTAAAAATAGSEVQSTTLQIGGLPSSATAASSSSSSSQATLTTTTTTANKQSSRIPINSTSSITTTVRDTNNKNSIKDDHQLQQQQQQSGSPQKDQTISDGPVNSSNDLIVSDNISGHHQHQHKQQPRDQTGTNGRADDCQVCHIKKVREDLMNLNKMIQERNIHFSELKAKCLRSYFKRQMID